jgi:hypothetical protein
MCLPLTLPPAPECHAIFPCHLELCTATLDHQEMADMSASHLSQAILSCNLLSSMPMQVSSLPHIEVRLQGASPDAPSSSSQSSPSSGPSRGTTHQRKAASALANAAAAAAAQAAAEAVASGAVQPVQAPVDVLLMLDTGACGTDIILHGRAMDEFGLWQYGRPSSQLVR